MTLAAIDAAADSAGLMVLGAFHPEPADAAPEGAGTLVLIGPREPEFWPVFDASPEVADRRPDPLDRWSRGVIGALAEAFGAGAVFPFGGPPHPPFTAWARRTGRVWLAPVGLLVHETEGLMVSFWGALALGARLDPGQPARRPCDTCAAPCASACPVGALTPAGYDLGACHGYLDSGPGCTCLARGCAVRRACPVGRGRRPDAQSAFHMAAFHGGRGGCDA